jgi:hypothetical protein
MGIFIRREPAGILLPEYTSPDEIEEDLKELESFQPLSDIEEVVVELTARWPVIKQLFQDIQFLVDIVRETDFEKGSERDKLVGRMVELKLAKI